MASAQTTVFSHTFDGDGASPVTAVNGTGSANWILDVEAGKSLSTNGTPTGASSAYLAYSFGTGIYEITATINVSSKPTNNTGLSMISFTTSDPVTAGYINEADAEAHASFGMRENGDFEMWGGIGTALGNDGGNLASTYGYGVSSTKSLDDREGTLRLVLDTTQTNWTIAGYYKPVGESEFQVDVNAGDGIGSGSYIYTYATNPDAFTGVGLLWSSNSIPVFQDFTVTSIPEPGTYGLLSGLTALLGLALRRRR